MRKILFLAVGILLVAASCNSDQTANVTYPSNTQVPSHVQTNQNASGQTGLSAALSGNVDAAVNALNAGVDSEESINLQSDDDIINSDASVINGYEGVTNASF